MVDIPVAGNGRKAQNRRAKFTAIALALITIAFYVCLFKGSALGWFVEYGKYVMFSLLFVVSGITATDAITKWRNGNGGTKP